MPFFKGVQGTVLVACHYPYLESLFRKALGRAGLNLAFVTRGDDAWAWLAANPPPEAVLAAVMMHGMNGFALAEAIRREDRLKTVPILLLGHHSNEILREDFERMWRERLEPKLGPCDMLSMPFHPDEMVRRVEALRARQP